MLNERLGPPTERLPQGEQTLKNAAGRLAISESELSRMRWLAHLFTSVEDLKQREPECDSWTKFKQRLPGLKPGGGDSAASEKSTGAALRGVIKSLESVTKRVRENGFAPSEDERKRVQTAIEALAEAVSDRFGIQVRIEPEPMIGLPPTAETVVTPATGIFQAVA
jgi:hypothetical protein